MDKRQLKLGLYGFLIVLFVSLISLKPYLPTALYHNFSTIYDYQFFPNRVITAKPPGLAWPESPQKLKDPDPETMKLLSDLKTTALLVLENGQIVYEKYFLTGGTDTLSSSFSMAKSMIGLLYGFALQERKIRSLDEPVERYLTEWEGREEGKITIRNLLTMSSGLNWNESYWNPFSVTAESYYGSNLYLTALKQRLVETPGTHFSYQSGSTQLLGLILSRAVNENLSSYLSQKLWVPLGAQKNALWSLDHEDGMEKAFCCVNATARDFARIGEFVRLGGKWNTQNLLNEKYIQEMLTSPALPNERGQIRNDYGYQWWTLRTPQGNLPFAWGILGQYVVVVPQKNRVLVRLGMKTGNPKDHYPEELLALVNWMLGR